MLYRIARALLIPVFLFFYNYRISGRENIPKSGAYIVCANHVSVIDPILVGISIPNRIYFMAKAELFRNILLRALLNGLGAFPIRRGEVDIKSIKTSLKLLKNGKVLALFPEGTRNKSGEVVAEPGIAMLATKSKAPIIPVAIISNYKFFKRTEIVIGEPIELTEYYDRKLLNDEYIKISLDIMRKINELKRDKINGNNS
ncbi:MAG: 1-acyl-sn-glycerol-3-phosphate acyltransferase [Gracilibacteraceae bacterium]|nr:1-acyl-sn-glycerol-3-phosphate acyltransferase [Gracilibacteraceae bacterium]